MARQRDVDRHGRACPHCGQAGCARRHHAPPPPPLPPPLAGEYEQISLDFYQEVEQR